MFVSLKKDNRTRGHEVTLVKDQIRLDIMTYAFLQRTVNECNEIFTICVTASSVNMFKSKVDAFLRRADYTHIENVGLSFFSFRSFRSIERTVTDHP